MEQGFNRFSSTEKIAQWQELASRLEVLQAEANPGMGVSCVRSIAMYLRKGDVESARAVADTDHDKIRNYPSIEAILIQEGFLSPLPSFTSGTKKKGRNV